MQLRRVLNKQKTNKPLIIVDTNTIIYLSNEKLLDEIIAIFNELKHKFELSISEITHYELVKLKANRIPLIINSLDSFENFKVNRTILNLAAIFSRLGMKDSCDCIIAATCFSNASYVLTADSGFSEPYFHEVSHWAIKYKNDKNRTVYQTIYLLKIDIKKVAKGITDP